MSELWASPSGDSAGGAQGNLSTALLDDGQEKKRKKKRRTGNKSPVGGVPGPGDGTDCTGVGGRRALSTDSPCSGVPALTPTEGDNSGSKFWSTGLLIDGRVLFTADTRFDPLIFEHLSMDKVETIFHDCQLHEPNVVHASYSQLMTLDETLRSKIYLTHYGDAFQVFDPPADGFAGFAQPWVIYQ